MVILLRSKLSGQNNALKPKLRTRALGFATAMLLAGCAMSDGINNAPSQRALLQPWSDLTSAQTATSMGIPSAERITLRRPTSVSARGNDIYLIDAGLQRIFRYDRNRQTLTPFATTVSVGVGMNIYAAPDRSVYITDPSAGKVLHFTHDGVQLPSLTSPGNLARPVAVTVNARNGLVMVADALYDKIVVFSSLGMVVSIIKPEQVLAISSMAAGSDGFFITDRLARRVVALDWDGRFRYAFGNQEMRQPDTITVSRNNLVFVSDSIDDTVHIYRDELLLAKIGGRGIEQGKFNGITGLAVDETMLYVADSMNTRVQIMMINPEQRMKK